MAQENEIWNAIKDKVFFSNFNNVIADVVQEIPEQGEKDKVYFDGMTLLDCIEDVEDDIQQVSSITKDGKKVNLEYYYQRNGCYNEDDYQQFVDALNQLMTKEEYEQYLAGDRDKLTFDKTNTIVKKCEINAVSVVLPAGVISIDSSAFKYCSKLTSITIPESVKSIGKQAFYGCLKLESIKLPVALEEIGEAAFAKCIGLTNICIPDSVNKIGKGSFQYCAKLREIHIKNPDLIKDAALGKNVKIITDCK